MYERVLVPTDGSDAAAAAAEHAIDIASAYGATVHALYVADVRMSPISTGMDREAVRDLLDRSNRDPTGAVRERADAAGVPVVEALRIGVPHEAIGAYVDDHDVDLVVMGTHGRTGLERTMLGSVTERVLRTVDAPVLTVRGEAASTPDGRPSG
ncbi:universal stress protein [Haloplanus halophilus]|uniref:universal stress protein n=1 Tax=Haloplanus halophilus TaxID=2949993 RepID=UPI00203FC703|nr:universal stress protein [Haloplanus sp. GDY1]